MRIHIEQSEFHKNQLPVIIPKGGDRNVESDMADIQVHQSTSSYIPVQGGGLELPVNCSHEGGMSVMFDFQVNHNLLQPLVPIPIFAPYIESQLMNMFPDNGEFSKLNRQPLRAFCLKWVENTTISAWVLRFN